jgi:hypothetical protein
MVKSYKYYNISVIQPLEGEPEIYECWKCHTTWKLQRNKFKTKIDGWYICPNGCNTKENLAKNPKNKRGRPFSGIHPRPKPIKGSLRYIRLQQQWKKAAEKYYIKNATQKIEKLKNKIKTIEDKVKTND